MTVSPWLDRRTRSYAHAIALALSIAPLCACAQTRVTDSERSARLADIETEHERLNRLIAEKGGLVSWWDSLEAFREGVTAACGTLEDSEAAIASKPLAELPRFFGGDERVYIAPFVVQGLCDPSWMDEKIATSAELSSSAVPVIANFSKQLERRGIDLIFMPIPAAEEVYPETLTGAAPADRQVSPRRTATLLALAEAGVEVVDLLPIYQRYRESEDESLYFYRDFHWSPRGAHLAAKAVAERLQRYEFAREAKSRDSRFVLREDRRSLRGYLEALMSKEQPGVFKSKVYQCDGVYDLHGQVHTEAAGAPILVLGDSNIGLQRFQEMGAHFAAYLGYESNLPVESMFMLGGFSKMNAMLARKGPDYLRGRRVVLWFGSWNYPPNPPWRAVKLPE